MSQALTYWWRKYQIIRGIKSEYMRKSKGLTGSEFEAFNRQYLVKLLESIN